MKAESEYFTNLKKGAFFGAFLSIYFGLNSIHKKLFSKKNYSLKPNRASKKLQKKLLFLDLWNTHSQLSLEKKINVVAILDHFLAPKECNSNTQGSQRVAKKWLPVLHYIQVKRPHEALSSHAHFQSRTIWSVQSSAWKLHIRFFCTEWRSALHSLI